MGKFLLTLACALCLLLVLSLAAAGQQSDDVKPGTRGITISLKSSEAAGAPDAGSVNLYPKSYALVIGNDTYTGGWSRLSNGRKDARAIAETLSDLGFIVSLKEDLDSRNLEKTISDFFFQYGGDKSARLFLWYAGHGHTDSRKEGYLVPTDAPLPSVGEFEFRRFALNMRRFGELVRQVETNHVYAVFDSCFAGTVFNSARAAPPAAITRAVTYPVRQFLTSGDADQTVSDDGTFRRLFIEAVRGERRADANSDGYLTASELGLFMGDAITNLSEGAQTPRYGKLRDPNFNRGDFVFASFDPSEAPASSMGTLLGGNKGPAPGRVISDSGSKQGFTIPANLPILIAAGLVAAGLLFFFVLRGRGGGAGRGDAQALFERGVALSQHDPIEALALFEEAAALEPKLKPRADARIRAMKDHGKRDDPPPAVPDPRPAVTPIIAPSVSPTVTPQSSGKAIASAGEWRSMSAAEKKRMVRRGIEILRLSTGDSPGSLVRKIDKAIGPLGADEDIGPLIRKAVLDV